MSYPRDLDEFEEAELVREIDLRRTRRAVGRCDYCRREAGQPPSCKFGERHHNEEAVRNAIAAARAGGHTR